jgi:hypothetical protein
LTKSLCSCFFSFALVNVSSAGAACLETKQSSEGNVLTFTGLPNYICARSSPGTIGALGPPKFQYKEQLCWISIFSMLTMSAMRNADSNTKTR